MTLPNALVIGTAKAGTTALYNYLRQHPQVHMSAWKEPKFFAFEGQALDYRGPDGPAIVNTTSVTTLDEYLPLFDGAGDARVVGEASAIYLYTERAPDRIRHHVPDAKMIAVLRDPAERAFSSYQHLLREGLEPLEFEAALDAEPQRIRDNWGFLWRYVDMGYYGRQLARYRELFDPAQMLILFYEDLSADALGTCRRVFEFLEIDPTFEPDTSVRHNVSGTPRNALLHRVLNPPVSVKRWLWRTAPPAIRDRLLTAQQRAMNRNLVKGQLPAATRARLVDTFREDIALVQEQTGRDLSSWLR